MQRFIDFKRIKTQGGSGGNGCISFLHLWSNDKAGPDGGNGGNGGHVILKATHSIKDLNHVNTVIKGTDGVKGSNKDCDGECADHLIVNVPVGTIIKNKDGTVIGDLDKEEIMFVAARGGAGGKGNHFFTTDTEQSPEICEYGAQGEIMEYTLELRSMAHMGLVSVHTVIIRFIIVLLINRLVFQMLEKAHYFVQFHVRNPRLHHTHSPH